MAPRGTGLLEQHFTLNLATKTIKTGQDYNCKYCGYLGKGWQGPARARAHLSGEKGNGVAACPNVPNDVKDKLLKDIYHNMSLLRKIRDPAFRERCVLPDHMFDEDEEEEEKELKPVQAHCFSCSVIHQFFSSCSLSHSIFNRDQSA